MAKRVILDTDIGTDVDDCLALALLLASPEIVIEGITTVYADVMLRARIALKLLRLREQAVLVYAGVSKPLLRTSIYWEGHEGEGILNPEDAMLQPQPQFAPDYIVQMARQHPKEIHLLCIGPLTNAALAFRQEPRLSELLASLTIMGGVNRSPNRLELPFAEHNIVCDPEAAQIVFSSGTPIHLIPLDVTTQVKIDHEGLRRLRAVGTPFHDAVADQLARYPRFNTLGWTNLHDPLAAAALIQPDLLTFLPVTLEVETAGKISTGATLMRTGRENPHIHAAVSVDAVRAEAFILDRLER